LVSAGSAGKKLLFLLYPLFRAKFSPFGNSSEYIHLSLRDGKRVHFATGKLGTLMASFDLSFHGACLDLTDLAVHENSF
jgi:hypothetical protein